MTQQALPARLPARRRGLGLPVTLAVYLGRSFLARFVTLFGGICAIVLLVTTVEQLDQLASVEGVSLLVAFQMALLKLPELAQEVMPFAILFSAMATFWHMTRTHELVVARSAGISVWQLLAPAVLLAVLVGVLTTTVLNPASSVLLRRFEELQARYTGSNDPALAVAKSGLWLRQVNDSGRQVIHARRVSESNVVLFDVIVFRFSRDNRFESRIDAAQARLQSGKWVLNDALLTEPEEPGRTVARTTVPTDLTPDKIYNSFAPPETISFWKLPAFIDLLESAGFAAEPHRLQLHRLLAKPVLLAAMVLLAAVFSLRPHRHGGVIVTIVSGVLAGFGIYVLSNLVFALGLSATLPVVMAAWTPAVVTLMLGVAILLHLEDG